MEERPGRGASPIVSSAPKPRHCPRNGERIRLRQTPRAKLYRCWSRPERQLTIIIWRGNDGSARALFRLRSGERLLGWVSATGSSATADPRLPDAPLPPDDRSSYSASAAAPTRSSARGDDTHVGFRRGKRPCPLLVRRCAGGARATRRAASSRVQRFRDAMADHKPRIAFVECGNGGSGGWSSGRSARLHGQQPLGRSGPPAVGRREDAPSSEPTLATSEEHPAARISPGRFRRSLRRRLAATEEDVAVRGGLH